MSPVVVIIDDHPVLASAIGNALEYKGLATAVLVDSEAPDAVELMVGPAPDLCLLDLDLGYQQAAGMRFVRAAIGHGLRVAMITGSTDEIALGRCIEAGAIGVIPKTLTFPEVIDRIQDLLSGEGCNSDTDLLRWVLAMQRDDAQRRHQLRPFESLTARERVVLQYLIDGQRVDEISPLEFVSVATVRSQVRSILQKLGVTSQLAAVATARNAGWASGVDLSVTRDI